MQLPSFKILWPSLNGFIGKFCPKNQKSPLKNHVFEFIDLKTTFEGQGTPIFFSTFANITSLEVPKTRPTPISGVRDLQTKNDLE